MTNKQNPIKFSFSNNVKKVTVVEKEVLVTCVKKKSPKEIFDEIMKKFEDGVLTYRCGKGLKDVKLVTNKKQAFAMALSISNYDYNNPRTIFINVMNKFYAEKLTQRGILITNELQAFAIARSISGFTGVVSRHQGSCVMKEFIKPDKYKKRTPEDYLTYGNNSEGD